MSYVDNCHRALSAAVQIRTELGKLGMQTSVGITCSDVYCGAVGSSRRMEYAAIGSAVNMAARIMGKAKGRLLLEESVHDRLPKTDHTALVAIAPMTVKGKSEPLQAYAATASVGDASMGNLGNVSDSELTPACRAAVHNLLNTLVS